MAPEGEGAFEEARSAGSLITFDTGALIALERRKERAIKVYRAARERSRIVAAPIDAVVMAFAATTGGVVYTSNVGDLATLAGFIPGVRVLAI